MSLVKAYHAGNMDDINSVILGGYGIPFSVSQGNWHGNIFENQHIQICLWDLTVIQNPLKYTGGSLD